MTLTANAGSKFTTRTGSIQAYTAGDTIYRGAVCALRLTTGLLHMVDATDTIDAYKQLIVGYAMEGGVVTGIVRVNMGDQILLTYNGIATGLEGKLACMVYNATEDLVQVYTSGQCNLVVGRIVSVPDQTHVFVNLFDRPLRIATSLYN